MNYLKFKNVGEISEEAIILLGASTKRDSVGKIGFFGSGNKFALAYLLRNGYEITLYGGTEQIVLSTVKRNLKDQEFEVIVVNGQQTSITTEFGAKWELWQALREIYSNALDEGDGEIELVSRIEPKENETHYYIKMRAELTEWFGNFNSYFSENKAILFENEHGKILKKHNDIGYLYRRGISVWKTTKNSLYDYDVNEIDITEDRIVKYDWQIGEKIWKIIYSCKDKEIIKKILFNCNQENLIENHISDFSDLPSNYISEEFKEVLSEMKLCNANLGGYLNSEEMVNTTQVPNKVFRSIKHLLVDKNLANAFKVGLDGTIYRELDITNLYRATFKKAEDFLNEAGCDYIYNEYPIKIGVFEEKKNNGLR